MPAQLELDRRSGAGGRRSLLRHRCRRQARHEGIQVISRAAAVLRRLAGERDGLTVIDIARGVGLPRSTTHRIVLALTNEGLARRTADGRFTLGLEFESLAEAARSSLRQRLGPHLLRLSEQTGETAELGVLSGGDVLFIDTHPSRQTLRVVSTVGSRAPVHATASGKALLAAMPEESVERMLPRSLTGLTRSTITSRDRLLEELDEVRSTGTAFDIEEHSLGVCSVATAVTDQNGETAALAIVVPTARFSTQERARGHPAQGDPADPARGGMSLHGRRGDVDSRAGAPSGRRVPALARGLRILSLFDAAHRELTLDQIVHAQAFRG